MTKHSADNNVTSKTKKKKDTGKIWIWFGYVFRFAKYSSQWQYVSQNLTDLLIMTLITLITTLLIIVKNRTGQWNYDKLNIL